MATKNDIRKNVWNRMTEEKVGRFPFPLVNRIPNFKGAERAVHHIVTLDVYKRAKVVKVNPDAPQLPLRARVLMDGKTLLIPTPRLKAGFIQIKPEWVPDGEERKAASLKHMKTYGTETPLAELPLVDLIVTGAVAVHRDGRRLGKGEGYADREYAIFRELGNPPVPAITTVHSLQVVEDDIPSDTFDLTLDYIATEDGLIQTNTPYEKPAGIIWEKVTESEMEEMPVLEEVKRLTRK